MTPESHELFNGRLNCSVVKDTDPKPLILRITCSIGGLENPVKEQKKRGKKIFFHVAEWLDCSTFTRKVPVSIPAPAPSCGIEPLVKGTMMPFLSAG